MYLGSLELRLPSPFPEEYGLHFFTFADFGNNFGLPSNIATSPDEASLLSAPEYGAGYTKVEYAEESMLTRLSVGAGILWKGPIGPLRIEFAKAIISEEFDSTLAITIRNSALAF